MIKNLDTGEVTTAKKYAQQLVARAVREVRTLGCSDEEMTKREIDLVLAQLAKITDRLLSKLVK